MKKIFTQLLIVVSFLTFPTVGRAIDNNTVEIVYSGTTATVTIADNIASYVTCSSGTSSRVQLVQASTFAGVDATTDNEDGEIIYSLSGSSDSGCFYLEGSYKCTVELNGLTLTNPDSAAVVIMNGKRIAVSAKKNTTNTLTDASNTIHKGCYHCKGHTKFKGKGTLTVNGNSAHAIYSKEYIEVKNLTLNITSAVKDAMHCKEYFLMESGTVNITSATDDGIQVELDGDTSTGTTTDHDDEDSGNFYQEGGTLTISSFGGKAIKADGSITNSGGTWSGFSSSDNEENASSSTGINAVTTSTTTAQQSVYDLQGRQVKSLGKGLYIINDGTSIKKVLIK